MINVIAPKSTALALRPSPSGQGSNAGPGIGRGNSAGCGGHAGRGNLAFERVAQYGPEQQVWLKSVCDTDEERRVAGNAALADREREARDRGFPSLQEELAQTSKVNSTYRERKTNAQGEFVYGETRHSTDTAASKAPQLSLPGTMAVQKVQQAAGTSILGTGLHQRPLMCLPRGSQQGICKLFRKFYIL